MDLRHVHAQVEHLKELAQSAPTLLPVERQRLYYDVLRAVADGSEVSAQLARAALAAEQIDSTCRNLPVRRTLFPPISGGLDRGAPPTLV